MCSVCCQNLSENSCGKIAHVLPWVWGGSNTSSSNATDSSKNNSRRKPPPLDCRNMQLNYSGAGRFSICCRHNLAEPLRQGEQGDIFGQAASQQGPDSFMSLGSTGRRITDRYVRDHLEDIPRRLCDRLSLERMQRIAPSSPSSLKLDPSLGVSSTQVEGLFPSLGCSSASPLNFYSIDQHNHWMFSDVLGVPSGPALVLVDKEVMWHTSFSLLVCFFA